MNVSTNFEPTLPPETSELMLEHGRAVASGSTRPSIWEKMADLEQRLIRIRGAADWAIACGQVVGGSKVALIEALNETAPKSRQNSNDTRP